MSHECPLESQIYALRTYAKGQLARQDLIDCRFRAKHT